MKVYVKIYMGNICIYFGMVQDGMGWLGDGLEMVEDGWGIVCGWDGDRLGMVVFSMR